MYKKIRVALVVTLTLVFALHSADKRPLIGITPGFTKGRVTLGYNLINAIQENGGVAIILAPTSDDSVIARYVEMLDGAAFSGGADIPAEFYGQTPHPTSRPLDPIRFEFDRRFITAFLNSKKPVIALCLGEQFSNVCRGGTLIQDIPSIIGTNINHIGYHPVTIKEGSLIHKLLGTTSVEIASSHHQAVDKFGTGFIPTAYSSDGVVEAIERTDGAFGIFVQWHPENMRETNREHRDRLFSAFVKEAQKQMK